MSNLLGGEQSMLEKLMAAQERIAELEAAALGIKPWKPAGMLRQKKSEQ